MNLTSPSQVKAWCIENGFHPNKNLGQNFLVDKNILETITETAGINPGDLILEIGPGFGVLTEAMLQAGAKVVAVEKDTRLSSRLAESLGNPPDLRVISKDALKLDWDTLLKENFAACVSNLPYSVGTRILLDLAFHPDAPMRYVILVQTEVAERFAARPGDSNRGQAGAWLQLDYDVTLVRTVKPACFWPRPEVDSTIVRLDRHPCSLTKEERSLYFALTRIAFMHRRKQLGSLLRKAPEPLACGDATLLKRFEHAGIDPQIRAERLSVAEWETLARQWVSPTESPEG